MLTPCPFPSPNHPASSKLWPRRNPLRRNSWASVRGKASHWSLTFSIELGVWFSHFIHCSYTAGTGEKSTVYCPAVGGNRSTKEGAVLILSIKSNQIKSVSQSVNQPINQSINQPINQSINMLYIYTWYCCCCCVCVCVIFGTALRTSKWISEKSSTSAFHLDLRFRIALRHVFDLWWY